MFLPNVPEATFIPESRVLVLNSMFRSGLVDTLVTHANKEGFGLTPLSGDRRGYMPPLLKTKTRKKSLGKNPD